MSLLILGGTAEARALGEQCRDLPGARLSLAGVTQRPAAQALPLRQGGFGGAAGFARYLATEKITAVLDATHPFAARITARSRAVCDAESVPYRQLLRPPWQPRPGEAWRSVPDAQAAVAAIPEDAVVLLTTGSQRLSDFADLHARRVVVRTAEAQRRPCPICNGVFLAARPPFTLPQEIALLRGHGITWLIAKNAGGAPGRTKLEAARRLSVRLVMIERPAGSEDRILSTPEAAMAWVRQGCPP